ncbi:MAG: ABC transporter substrate-binding protein [Actinomycetota bacterium]
MSRYVRWIAVLAVLGVVAAACQGGGDEPTSSATADTGDIPTGGTVRIGVSSEPASAALDPAKEYYQLSFEILKCCLARTLYSTNGKPADEGGTELRPDLAADLPTVSEDGLTWTIPIKQGVTYGPPFEDVEITAQDFIRALEREADPKASTGGYIQFYLAIEGFPEFSEGKADSISGLTAVDDHTLQIVTSEPTGDLGWRLSMPATAPIPPNGDAPLGAAEGHTKNYGQFLVATGPYMFEGSENMDFSLPADEQEPAAGYTPGRSIVLVRNPSWSAETDDLRPAYADEITIEIGGTIPDLYNKVTAGDLDYVMDPPEADTLKEYSTDPDLQDRLHVYPQPATSYTSMNLGVPPFDDVQVRKAVNYAYDKAGGRQLAGGPLIGTNAGHIFPDGLLNNLLVDYDPYATPEDSGDIDLAKAEMEQSKYDTDQDGVCDDESCKNVLALYNSDTPTGRKIAALWQQQLEQIGIELEVRGLSTTPMYAKCTDLTQRVPICLAVGWLQDYPDAWTFGPSLFGSVALYPGCCNYSALGASEEQMKEWGYPVTSVPSVDEDLDRCSALPVGDERTQCWADLDTKLMEEIVPWVPRTFTNQTDIVGPNVVNYSYDEFGYMAALDHFAVEPAA